MIYYFIYVYIKDLYIYAYIAHLPTKKPPGRIIVNSSSSSRGKTKGQGKEDIGH